MRRPFTAPVLIFLGFWLGLLVFLRSQPFNDPGSLWHVRVGDLLRSEGFFRTDPFTWSHAHQPWIPQQWLAEILLSLAHEWGGFDTMLLGLATLIASFATWVALRFVRGGCHPALAFVLTGAGVTVAAFHFYLRPHLFTFVGMGLVMGLIVNSERHGIRWGRWLGWIALSYLWTNLHGGVMGAWFTLGLAILGWWLCRRHTLGRSLLLGLILLASMLVSLLNPYGLDLPRTWWSIVGSAEVKGIIAEHKPIDPTRLDGLGILMLGAIYLLVLAGSPWRSWRVSWLLPLAWLALACGSIRHGPLFCSTALVAMADCLPHTVWFRLLRNYGDTLVLREPYVLAPLRWRLLVPGLAVLLALGLQRQGVPAPVLGAGWARLDPRGIPLELVEPLQAYARTRPDGYPIFNDANLGGFLIYFTPSLRIYFDDRCELYGGPALAEYVDFVSLEPERILGLMEQCHFEKLLVGTDTPLDRYLLSRPEWFRETHRTVKAVLFERR